MAEATPEVPFALSPTWNGKVWLGSSVHTSGAFAATYSEKFCVVPESSERCTTVMFDDGRSTPSLSAAISSSFHLVILPEKMPAMLFASRVRSETPSTL